MLEVEQEEVKEEIKEDILDKHIKQVAQNMSGEEEKQRAKAEMEEQMGKITKKYDLLLDYFALWMLPKSKENRRLFVMLNKTDAINAAVISLFHEFFGEKAGQEFVARVERHLEEIIKSYEEETGMIATEQGLKHVAK